MRLSLLLTPLLATVACSGNPRISPEDADAAAAVLRAIAACSSEDRACVEKAIEAARQVAPRLTPPPAASSSGGGS